MDKIKKKKYSLRRFKSLDEWFGIWIDSYLMADDAFDMDLRESVVKDQLNDYVKEITGRELPRELETYCSCSCHDGEYVDECRGTCGDCFKPMVTHLVEQESENDKPHNLCKEDGGKVTWSMLEFLDSKNKCKKCYQIYIASRDIQTS